jgi:hypothetical protein
MQGQPEIFRFDFVEGSSSDDIDVVQVSAWLGFAF